MASLAHRVGSCVAVLGLAVLLTSAQPVHGAASSPDPELTTASERLQQSLTCSGDLHRARRAPVLLVAGTGGTPEENFSWNYMPALSGRGIPWCGVEVPDHTLSDVQMQAEYIVHAIRTMHRQTHRSVSIMGYSQGGMTPRWALRWWPGVRRLVDDMISLAAPNHGVEFAEQAGVCAQTCHPAAWQNLPGSELLAALNAPFETARGISYSQIFTNHDQLSTPAGHDGTSPLHTGQGAITNVALQDVCPANVADHMMIGSVDPVAWALVIDALDHPGPANPSRVGAAVCSEVVLPGVDVTHLGDVLTALPYLASAATPFDVSGVEKVSAPPPLRAYTQRPQLRVRRSGSRALTFEVVPGTRPVAGVRVTAAGRTRWYTPSSGRSAWSVRAGGVRLPARIRILVAGGNVTCFELGRRRGAKSLRLDACTRPR